MRTYGKLREKVRDVFGSQAAFAEAMGEARKTIALKLNGGAPWKDFEIEGCCQVLGIPKEKIPEYFFYDE